MSAHNDPVLRRLAAGVLWPGFIGTSVPDWLARALEEGLAGVVYFAGNLDATRPERIRDLSRSLRTYGEHVLIGADEEGGPVTRLHAHLGSRLPSHAQLGALNEASLTRRVGENLGASARAVGINVVLAPVGDVNTNPHNPVIGVRSFGSTPELVSRHVSAMITGIQSQRVAACVKHFPGHGDTSLDSHLALPRFEGGHESLVREHLPPFFAAIEAGVSAIMTTHVVIPSLGELPATVNPGALGLLRELGFGGVLVTDALDMNAISGSIGLAEGAVQALAAGADLLCVGNPANPGRGLAADEADFHAVFTALLAALDDGRLSAEQLEHSVERNRAMGNNSTMSNAQVSTDASEVTTSPAEDFATDVRRAISLASEGAAAQASAFSHHEASSRIVLVDLRAGENLAVGAQSNQLVQELAARIPILEICSPRGAHNELETWPWQTAKDLGGNDRLVVQCNSLHAGTLQRELVTRVLQLVPNAIVINSGLVPEPRLEGIVVTSNGDSRITAEVVAEILTEHLAL